MAVPPKNTILLSLLNAAEKEITDDSHLSPGKRRIHGLSREITRPLETRLYWGRVHGKSEIRLSHELDIHLDDLDTLGRMAGQI